MLSALAWKILNTCIEIFVILKLMINQWYINISIVVTNCDISKGEMDTSLYQYYLKIYRIAYANVMQYTIYGMQIL